MRRICILPGRRAACFSHPTEIVRRGSSSRGPTALLSQAQWQGEGGSNADGLVRGCSVVAKALQDLLPHAVHLPVPAAAPPRQPQQAPRSSEGVRWHEDLVTQTNAALQALDAAGPAQVFTAGGDCSVDLAPAGWLQSRYHGDVAVLYLDAHADLNTASESPSGHFHGMVLRALLGAAPKGLEPRLPAEPASLVYAGLRELDPAEEAIVRELGLVALPPQALRSPAGAATLRALLRGTGRRWLHIHLDLDVLEPASFPHVSVQSPGGLSVEELRLLLGAAKGLPTVGLTVTEARPRGLSGERECAEVLHELLGPRGLDVAALPVE